MDATNTNSIKPGVVVVLGTGGTIAGTAAAGAASHEYTAAQVGVGQLVAAIAELAVVPLECQQVAQLDSKDMGVEVWLRLAQACIAQLQRVDVAGLVVTHGTDTLEETAYFLQRVLPPALLADRAVVLTCAMRSASDAQADGPQNLLDAVTVARHADSRGLLMVAASTVHAACHIQKRHSQAVDAFTSGDAAVLARLRHQAPLRAPHIDWSAHFYEQNQPLPSKEWAFIAIEKIVSVLQQGSWPWVEIITSVAQADARSIDALRKAGVDGVVVAATGNGTVHEVLEAALVAAQAQGLAVLRATRCGVGGVQPKRGDVLRSTDLPPAKARLALALQLLGVAT
jgi:L-asparaginase